MPLAHCQASACSLLKPPSLPALTGLTSDPSKLSSDSRGALSSPSHSVGRAYALPVGLDSPRQEPQQPLDAGTDLQCPCPAAFSGHSSLVRTPPLPCVIWVLCCLVFSRPGTRGRVRERNDWALALCYYPHSISRDRLTEPPPAGQNSARPWSRELSARGRKQAARTPCSDQGATEGRRGGNEGPRQLLRTPLNQSWGGQETEIHIGYLQGRSQSVPPRKAACRNSCPHLPCPLGRGREGAGSGQAWSWEQKLEAEPPSCPPGPSRRGRQLPQGSQRSRAVLTW